MWRYVSGAKPPAKKQKTQEETRYQQLIYDQNVRKRSFQTKWTQDFPWLVYDKDIDKMFCKICKEAEPKGMGSFITGSSTFKMESLKAHNTSLGHVKYFSQHKAKLSNRKHELPAEGMIRSLNKDIIQKLQYLFRNVHYIIKQGKPYTDYPELCKLDKAKSIDVGLTYINEKQAQIFGTSIATVQRDNISAELSKAPFVSIISDGATDSAHKEAEIVFVRFAVQGIINIRFAGIRNIGKPNAENITAAIVDIMDSYTDGSPHDWKEKLVGMATDGASVMLGKHGGVVKKIKDLTGRPYIQAMHCSAHRLELSYKDACRSVNLFSTCDALLLSLYLFYRNSPLNKSNLEESFRAHDMVALVPSRVGGTRWLGHTQRALKNVLTGYGPIVEHLKQIQNPDDPSSRKDSANKAKHFQSLLLDRRVITFLFFLWDVVNCLTDVSESFQMRSATIGDIHTEIQAAKITLQRLKEHDGPKLKLIQDKDTVQGHGLQGSRVGFETARKDLIDNLMASLDRRFEVDESILRASAIITNFKFWPITLSEQEDFGDRMVGQLVDVFQAGLKAAGVDTSTIDQEWTKMKVQVYQNYQDLLQSGALTWQRLNTALRDTCSNMLRLMDLMLTIPATSVEAERGFSLMKKIKSDWRSQLTDQHLSDLMLVALESPSVEEFDPTDSINHWNNSSTRSRRPVFMENQGTSRRSVSVDDDNNAQAVAESLQEMQQMESRAFRMLQAAYTIAKNIHVDALGGDGGDL